MTPTSSNVLFGWWSHDIGCVLVVQVGILPVWRLSYSVANLRFERAGPAQRQSQRRVLRVRAQAGHRPEALPRRREPEQQHRL
jgi:hypothetical protein